MRHYTLALQEMRPEDRAAERGRVKRDPEPNADGLDPKAAARHQDALARMYLRQGKVRTYADAVRMATKAAPQLAKRAGIHPSLLPDATPSEGAKHYGLVSGARKHGITIRQIQGKK